MGKWPMVRLGDVCEVVTGSTPSTRNPDLWNGDTKWVTPAEISNNTYFVYDTVRHISEKSGLCLMPAGTVLLSSRAPIGKVAITGESMCCNQGFKNLICSEKIHNRYLFRYLKTQTRQLNDLGRGATFKEISKTIVEEIVIPLPPLPVQQKIADILDLTSDLIEKRKEQISKLDLLVKSQFIEMFGDPVTNPMGWGKVPLFECLYRIDSGNSTNCESHSRSGNTPAILKLSAVTYGVYNPNENKELPTNVAYDTRTEVMTGDLLLTRKNTIDMVGMAAYVYNTPPNLLMPDLIFRLVTRENCNRVFLWQLINHPASRNGIQSLATGSAASMPNISKQRLMQYTILLPPLSLQNRFAEFVQQADKSKAELQQGLQKLELLYKSLMQKCFAGELF